MNSANLGPYGDAITYELIPYIEEQFRGIGEGWARFLYGGSTGGWEALAVQVFYPDEYNGAFAACPDPIDFRAYMSVNIYEDENAYYDDGPFRRIARPAHRNWLGHDHARPCATTTTWSWCSAPRAARASSATSGRRSTRPVGEDGYPRRSGTSAPARSTLRSPRTGARTTTCGHILERDWATLGPKLAGKIHIYCGDMDNYYLNNAVYLIEEFLESTTDPYYAGEVDYGDRAEHCWNGDHENGNHISRLRYNTMYVERILERIEASAAGGADLTSWKY